MNRYAYLAAPIDQAQGAIPALAQASSLLEEYGYVIYNPGSAWSVSSAHTPDRRLQDINDWVLSRCDLLLALLPAATPTIGTPIEIISAREASIPTLTVIGSKSWVLPADQDHVNHPVVSMSDGWPDVVRKILDRWSL